MTELLLIGFDGGDPALLQRWMEEGELPNLKKIAEKGFFSPLRSTELPITPCAWTTFMTGKNPGKHGVFDFTRITEDRTLDIISFREMDERTFFEITDLNTVTLNVPATYPPRELENGFMVSGMMTPSIKKSCTEDRIVRKLKDLDYQIEIENTFQGDNEESLVKGLEDLVDKRKKTSKMLLEEEEPGVFMVTFVAGDRASHWFWKHMEEEHPDHEESEYRDTIKKFYREIDSAVGELIEEAGEETNIVVLSDHGFTGLEGSININNLLLDEGYLKLKERFSTKIRKLLFDIGLTMENVYSVINFLNMGGAVKKVADSPDTGWLMKILSWPFLGLEDVDWERTDAFSALHFGPVFLTCEDERKEELKKEIAGKLESIEKDGEKIIDALEFKEDVFSGKRLSEAPDIIYRTRGMKYQSHRYFEFASNKLFSRTHNTESGHHRMDGILLGRGPNIKDFSSEEQPGLEDIAPTLLRLLGEEVPEDMDGEPLDVVKSPVERHRETEGVDI